MTPRQKQIAKEKRERRRERERLRKQRRKEKREAKALPRKQLKEWAEAVQKRDGYKCVVCGATTIPKLNADGTQKLSKNKIPVFIHLHTHHILPRERYKQHRSNINNGLALCVNHHKRGRYSVHLNPVWFILWLRENRSKQYEWAKANVGKWDEAKEDQKVQADPQNAVDD